jgi:hypothetical protein
MMKVQALWYGGSNYALPTQDDIEEFASIAAAKRVFEHRAGNTDRYYPCVEESQTEMHLYFHEYTENGPDRILKIGPRGGIVMERG